MKEKHLNIVLRQFAGRFAAIAALAVSLGASAYAAPGDVTPTATAPVAATAPAPAPAAPVVPAAPKVVLKPASPIEAPSGADPFSVPIMPNAPMPSFVSGLPAPHAFDIAIKQFNDGRFTDAVTELAKVQASATYRNSAYVPAALYRIAQINRDYMHEDQPAMTQYGTLIGQYGKTVYPGSATVVQERLYLAKTIDDDNAKKPLFAGAGPNWTAIQYKVISACVKLTGSKSYSYWIALLMIAVLVRAVLTPLTIKQYKGMREMQRLQPLMKEIQAKYEKDPQLKGQKMMELYKEHNVSPMSGCLPMLLQLPVYYFMYQAVVQYQYHFSNGTFLWINATTSAWANKIYPGIIGPNLMEQDMFLLLIYSVSMYVTQRMMPATDPSQAEMQKTTALMMSVFFFFMFIQWHFASAFVLYWLFSNILGTVTQLYFMRQGNTAPAGVVPNLPSDGEIKNGSGKLTPMTGTVSTSSNVTTARRPATAKPAGTARGIIAPKTHPKKKRR